MNDYTTFFALLEKLGITSSTVEHRAVHSAREILDDEHDLEFPVKNIFVRDKEKQFFLISMRLDTPPLDLKLLAERVGTKGRFTFATPEELADKLRVLPGSVSPYAVIHDTVHEVKVVLDDRLQSSHTISAHPLINTMTTTIMFKDLLALYKHTGHEPMWCEMVVR